MGTPFDFTAPRLIRDAGVPLDINFAFGQGGRTFRQVARLVSGQSRTALDVWTTEPGLQVYDGHLLPPNARLNLYPFAGICLEPQLFPDTPNQPGFPTANLNPGESYFQKTEYRFGETKDE
jgi:aldose 1-epimerase